MPRIVVPVALLLALSSCTSEEAPPADRGLSVPEGKACSDDITLASEGQDHIGLEERATYATDPPASGPHWGPPGGPVPAAVYNEAFADEATVHNLEHGHVIVHHNGLPPDVVEELEAMVRADPVQMLMVSRPSMPWVVALTAWTVAQVCDETPEDPAGMLRAFVRAHRDHAPESVP